MRKKSDYVLMLALLIGDGLMLVMSFAMAYFIRVHVDPRPYEFESQLLEFTKEIALLVPIMLVILAALGLYKKSVFMGKSRVSEIGKLVLAAVLSVAALIVYDYFMDRNIFPVRVVAVLAAGLSFVFLLIERVVVITVARQIFKRNYGTKRALIIGNQKSTEYLADYISSVPESGYRLAGIVAGRRFIPEDLMKYQFSSLKEALKQTKVDVIFQTDEKSTEYVYRQAINRHLMYYFVPSEAALSSHFGELELIGNTPAVMVKLTPLSGGGAIVKRALDVVLSCIGLVFAAIPMLITWVVLKISEPGAPAIYKDERLTQDNRKVRCY